jgi:hypothetical protein
MASKIGEVLEIELEDSYIKRPVGPMIMVETHASTSSPDTFVSPPWQKGQPQRIPHHKESYTRASQINAGNVADLGILPELAQ